MAYDPEPGFPFGRDRSDYSGTGEGGQKKLTPAALGEVSGVRSGKAYGAGAYHSMSPSTATGYRFMRSGLDRDLSAAAMRAAQERVDFADAGGGSADFQSLFAGKIDDVEGQVENARLGLDASQDAYRAANKTAAERIMKMDSFDSSRYGNDPTLNAEFYRNVVSDFDGKLTNELYSIRDLQGARMDYGDPGYKKMVETIHRDFPNLASLTPKQMTERRREINEIKKQYADIVNKAHRGNIEAYSKKRSADQAQSDLKDFEVAVTGDLPGVLYKTQIQEGKLGSFFDYDDPIDSQILTQATNALGVDAMNAKLFGTGPNVKKLQYNPKTQQYSLPEPKRRSQFSQNLQGSFPLNPTERMLAPKTVSEAKLYRDAGITHGQHTDRGGVTNKIFFADDATPVPVGRYNRGGQVGMGLGSR